MKRENVNVLVVDDHQLFRNGLTAILTGSTNVATTVREAADGHTALQLLEEQPADIILLDLNMPGLNGISTCKRVLKKYPDTIVLILSWHCETTQVIDLLSAGAKGFLSKDCSKDELLTAIHALRQGGSYFSQSIAKTVINYKTPFQVNGQKKGVQQLLTNREMEILECIANEFTNKEIARQLYISQRTVETHRRNLIQKLKVKNTVGLVKYYFNSFGQRNKTLRINT